MKVSEEGLRRKPARRCSSSTSCFVVILFFIWFFNETANDPAARGRPPTELNGKGWNILCSDGLSLWCRGDTNSSVPDGGFNGCNCTCIRSKIVCLAVPASFYRLYSAVASKSSKNAALPIPYTIYEDIGFGLSLSLSTLYSQNVDEQPSLQICLMWNAHERRSEKYSQSTRMLTNFKTVCGVPGANIHSLATCFHVIVGRPPNYSKIIHRHTYSPL